LGPLKRATTKKVLPWEPSAPSPKPLNPKGRATKGLKGPNTTKAHLWFKINPKE